VTNAPVAIASIAALPGIFAAWAAYTGARRTAIQAHRTSMLAIEAGAYERARAAYEGGIEQLEEQVERLRLQIQEERGVSDVLRRQIMELEETVARMRVQLIRAGIDLPAVYS